MILEMVSHCVNYTRFAMYQLSSLHLHPPSPPHELIYTFCYAEDDPEAQALVAFFAGLRRENVHWNWKPMRRSHVNRRAMGRNQAALNTRSDWIWFVDADYCVGPGCLDALAALAAIHEGDLVFPSVVNATSHEAGEALIAGVNEPRLLALPLDAFITTQEFTRAIGGVQIARSEAVRRVGYAPNRANRPARTWRRPVEDVIFRKSLGTSGSAVALPEVYRIRHRPWASFSGPPPF